MSSGQSEKKKKKALEEMPEWILFVKTVASDNVAVVLGGQRFRSCYWIIFQTLKPLIRH